MGKAFGQALTVSLAVAGILSAAGCLAQGAGDNVGGGRAASAADNLIKKVRLDQRLNERVPLDITFRDETGNRVPLRQFFGSKPVMLNLIQYRCTMLCSEEMKMLGQSLKDMKFSVGRQFNVLTVSIDSREQPYLAAEYKQGYLKQYGRAGAAAGWHCLTGDAPSIQRLADAVGYHFVYDARTDQFAHPDGVIVLTPQGKIARYFFRLNYPPRDLGFALMDAAQNRIGSPLDALALLCYHYNPLTGKYSVAFMRVLQLAAIGTLLLLGAGTAGMSLHNRQEKRHTRLGEPIQNSNSKIQDGKSGG
jgi:protein SCO1